MIKSIQVATDGFYHDTGARPIHWYTMDVILGEQSTLFATSKPFSQMGFYGWENWPIFQKKTSPLSMVFSSRVMYDMFNCMDIQGNGANIVFLKNSSGRWQAWKSA